MAEIIGLRQLSFEWGRPVRGRVYADSTAALAIAKRKGCGKMRHINVGLLWVQEKKAQGVIDFTEVEGNINQADVMSKYFGPATLADLCGLIGTSWIEGPAKATFSVKA